MRKYFNEGERYEACSYRINDKIKLEIDPGFGYGLPWVTIFNGELTVGTPRFRSTERALERFSPSWKFAGNRYNDFIKILEEIEHKENWEKYKNDKYFGDEILLYEQADEVANEVNKKYGTNITFYGGENCGYKVTFSIKDKSLEEVIREIEKNIPALYEASEKANELIDDFKYRFLNIPKDKEEQIYKKNKGKI